MVSSTSAGRRTVELKLRVQLLLAGRRALEAARSS
jgi:hypothetical protein